jgi:hypothetical protein
MSGRKISLNLSDVRGKVGAGQARRTPMTSLSHESAETNSFALPPAFRYVFCRLGLRLSFEKIAVGTRWLGFRIDRTCGVSAGHRPLASPTTPSH